MAYPNWFGKTAVITGGTAGIGLAVGEAMARRGVNVVLVGRNEAKGETAVKRFQNFGGKASFCKADVTDPAAIEGVVQVTIDRFGKLDFMVNNAGLALFGQTEHVDLQAWRDIIETNLMGVVHGVIAAYPRMIAQRDGHIVNIGSVGSFFPSPILTTYVASKFGVAGLSRSLRLEARRYGVRVSLVCPPGVQTDMIESARLCGIGRARLKELLPGGMMAVDKCAEIIVTGIARNKALILPGSARILYALQQFAPFIANAVSDAMGRKLTAYRSA